MLTQINDAVKYLQSQTEVKPQIGVILGTGLGGLVDEINITNSISYEDIPHFPVSTVEGHSGRLIFGELGGKQVMAMQGRDRKSTRLNSSHVRISYAVFCLKKKKKK